MVTRRVITSGAAVLLLFAIGPRPRLSFLEVTPPTQRDLAVGLTSASASESSTLSRPSVNSSGPSAVHRYTQAAMVFEPNLGQADAGAEFVARGVGYSVAISGTRARMALREPAGTTVAVVDMNVVGGLSDVSLEGRDPRPGVSHYFLDGSSERSVGDVPHFGRVEATSVYSGIDVAYRGNQRHLEYDFIVAPGADPAEIRMRFDGHDTIDIADDGSLILGIGTSELRHAAPIAWELPGHAPVKARFSRHDDGTIGFDVGEWDRRTTLVIDPTVVFGTYLGGSANDNARAVAVDAAGSIYVGGATASTNFPTVGPYQAASGGGTFSPMDAFVTKLSPDGSTLIYSTYLGGTGNDDGRGIAVDSSGSAYLAGKTSGPFPNTSAINLSCTGGFVTKLTPAGNALSYSACIDAGANAIALDATNVAHVTGVQPGLEVFVGALNATGTAWVYTRTLAGSSSDEGFGIDSDSAGSVCVTGQTWSSNFPVVNALQSTSGGAAYDAFVAKYLADGTLVYSTYLGGNSLDIGLGVSIDEAGNCYVVGSTLSTTFPTMNAAQSAPGGGTEGFVTAYNSSGNAYLYSTYFGGSFGDVVNAVTVDGVGVAHVVGQASSANLPGQAGGKVDYGSVQVSTNVATSFANTTLSNVWVQALVVDPTNAQVIYAGTSAGIYKSSNGGTSWARVDSGLSYTNIRALAIDPNDSCAIHAGIDTGITNTNAGSIILVQNTNGVLGVSGDCGLTWGHPSGGPAGRETRSLSFGIGAPAAQYAAITVNTVVAGNSTIMSRVVRSLSGVSDFSFMFEDFNYVVAADPTEVCAAYVGGQSGTVRKNASCGTPSWSVVGTPLTGGVTVIAPHPTTPNALLAGTSTGLVYRKSDAASAWVQVATLSGSIGSIVFQPGNASVVLASSAGRIFKSLDGGASWALTATIGPVISKIGVSAAAPGTVYVGTLNNADAFYTRFSPTGTLIDTTWIGGHGGDIANAIALDPDQDAVIVGTTSAVDFPASGGSTSAAPGGGDSFVAKVTSATPPPPGAFSKSAPVSGAVGQATSPALSWGASSGATSYEYCVDTTNNSICNTSWVSIGTATGVTAPGLTGSTSYYWQVRAHNDGGVTESNAGTWWSFSTLAPDVVQNGGFSSGTTGWLTFGLPDISGIVSNVTGGVFQFYRSGAQAVVFQQTGLALSSLAPIVTEFDLGNSDGVRKRISVLVHDSSFADLAVCTFWLPANSPLRTYRMRTHTTQAWTNATISFYAASAGSGGGFYQLDNVSLRSVPTESTTTTVCPDPTVPTPPGGASSATLLGNGDFGVGLAPWATFGTLTSQIVGGVFEFVKLSTAPPTGVLLQATGQTAAANEILTATFQLGNSSTVRKRVTVILHDNDFSDLSACTFWLAPGQPLSTYSYRTFATEAWTNVTLSVYPATVGAHQWMRLDNVTLQRTPTATIVGTECIEPGTSGDFRRPEDVRGLRLESGEPAVDDRPPVPAAGIDGWVHDGFVWSDGSLPGAGTTWVAVAETTGHQTLLMEQSLDLTTITNARLTFRSWLSSRVSRAEVQVSFDGVMWETVHVMSPSDTWVPAEVDLAAYVRSGGDELLDAGGQVHVRLVFDAVAPTYPAQPDVWRITELAATMGND